MMKREEAMIHLEGAKEMSRVLMLRFPNPEMIMDLPKSEINGVLAKVMMTEAVYSLATSYIQLLDQTEDKVSSDTQKLLEDSAPIELR